MSEIWEKITGSFGKLKEKIKGVAANPTPSPLLSNASSIQGGGKRRGSKRSGSKRQKRKRSKKVRFSKKNKVYTYKRK